MEGLGCEHLDLLINLSSSESGTDVLLRWHCLKHMAPPTNYLCYKILNLNLNTHLQATSMYSKYKEKDTNKMALQESKQINPHCAMFCKCADPVSLTSQIQRREKGGNRRGEEILLIMRGSVTYQENVMCRPCLDPEKL